MTRTEQAKKGCEDIIVLEGTPSILTIYNQGVEAGAKWADSHPNWHKYPDEKPSLGQRILIYTTKGRIAETVWHQPTLVSGEAHGEPTFEDNRYNKHNVIAWMEKPQPPKFD